MEIDEDEDYDREPDEITRIQYDWGGHYEYRRNNPLKQLRKASKQQSLDYYHVLFPNEERPTKLTDEHREKMKSAPLEAIKKAEEQWTQWLNKLSDSYGIEKTYISNEEYEKIASEAYKKRAVRMEQKPAVKVYVAKYRKYLEDL